MKMWERTTAETWFFIKWLLFSPLIYHLIQRQKLGEEKEGMEDILVLWPSLAYLILVHLDPLMGGKTGPGCFLLVSGVKRAGLFLSNLTAFWEWPALSLPLGVVGVSSGNQCGLSCRTPVCALYFKGLCPLSLSSGHFAWMCDINGSCEQTLWLGDLCEGLLQKVLAAVPVKEGGQQDGQRRRLTGVIDCNYNRGLSHAGQQDSGCPMSVAPPFHTPSHSLGVSCIPFCFMIFINYEIALESIENAVETNCDSL